MRRTYDCSHKPPKPILPIKTLDVIFRRRHHPNTQYYFTNRKHHAAPVSKVSSFKVPKTDQLLSYIKYRDRKDQVTALERRQQPLYYKDNIRITATRDISQRLYVEEPPDDVKAVVEIHPEFYTAVEGRPLRAFDDIKVYISNIRGYAMYNSQIGYRKDLILKINTHTAQELNEYDNINKQMKDHIKNFQIFLTEDYKNANALVSKAEKVYGELLVKNTELVSYITQLTMLNNTLFNIDYTRHVMKVYRSFLLFAAPIYWREQYDESYKRLSIDLTRGKFAMGQQEFTQGDLNEDLDIDRTVDVAKAELKDPKKAYMYFTHPDEMIYLFRTMELQSREYLIQVSKMHSSRKKLQNQINLVKQSTQEDIELFYYFIDIVNKETELELENERALQEKFMRILNGTFYDLIASPTTLKLKICVEFVCEQLYGKCKEGFTTLRDPTKILELFFNDINLRLDQLDYHAVNKARSECFAQDLKMLREAYLAQRILREFREMSDSMQKAFLPPLHFKRPEVPKFMNKKTRAAAALAEKKKRRLMESGHRVQAKKFKISAEEHENLILFTDWCDGMDPAPYLEQIDMYVRPALELEATSESSSVTGVN